VIEQAKGMLIAEHGCSPDEAFHMISHASQRENRKVRDIAEGRQGPERLALRMAVNCCGG
jgi:hypothetical protein